MSLHLLAACSDDAPGPEEIEALFKEAEQTVGEVPDAYYTSIYALVAVATERAKAQNDAAARAVFDIANAKVRSHESHDAAWWRGITLSHIAAAEAALGFDEAAGTTASASLASLQGMTDARRRSAALIEAAQEQAAAGATEATVNFLAAATGAARMLPDGSEKTLLFRQAAAVYQALGVPERGRDTLYEADSSAWLEEDALQQATRLVRLAEDHARLGGVDEALAIMHVLPANFREPVQAALIEARLAQADLATAESEAAALTFAYWKAQAYMAIAEHYLRESAPEQAQNAALTGLAAARGNPDSTKVVQFYAFAAILVRAQDLNGAIQALTEAMQINREHGTFWNFNEFSDANVALAAAGELLVARQLAELIQDPDQRARELAKIEVVRAGYEAREGRFEPAVEVARAIEDPYIRTDALLAVIAGSRERSQQSGES